ncbi:MAG: amylo-alpha-1,6-glucosidase [Candidatus Woesearchaeota archaeon]
MSNEEAYEKAKKILYECSTKHGFIAAKKQKKGNYNRIWARDSMICSISAFMSDDPKLIGTAKQSLVTLIKNQHEQGEIPSNVDPLKNKVSFGGTSGRVDAQLWFLIGFGQYVKKTNDRTFAKAHFKQFEKTIQLVRIYEFNHKSLIYVPQSGDWADEYIQEGYVLYDQLLYYQAFCEYAYLQELLKKPYTQTKEKIKRIKETIRINYWPIKKNLTKAFHRNLYAQYTNSKRPYLLPFFHPGHYGLHFDLFANSLAMLLHITTPFQKKRIIKFVTESFELPPCFAPTITKRNPLYKKLEVNYGHTFRNYPHQYHNGGIWPMILGFYVSASPNKKLLNKLVSLVKQNNWEYNEVYHGKKLIPHGTPSQAWSAAGIILAYETQKNKKKVFL